MACLVLEEYCEWSLSMSVKQATPLTGYLKAFAAAGRHACDYLYISVSYMEGEVILKSLPPLSVHTCP